MVSDAEAISGCLKALGDPTRIAIIATLKAGELSVHQVADRFPMSRPAISKHLRILREAGLVAERAEGRERIYSLDVGPLSSIRHFLAQIDGAGNGFRGSPGGERRRARVRSAGSASGQSQGDWRVW